MNDIKELAAALIAIQAEVGVAITNKENPHLRSKYADLGAVWAAIAPALTKHKVAAVQIPVFHDGQQFLRTVLIHESGQSIEGEYLLRPVKDDPQAWGSCLTYARRYSLAAMIGVVSGDDDDGHRASGSKKTGASIDKVKKPDVLSAAERLAMRKVWLKAGKTDEMVQAYLKEAYDLDSTAKIEKRHYQELMAWCAEPKPGAAA